MNPIAYSLLGMLIALLIELVILKLARKPLPPLIDSIFNLNSGHIIMWLGRGVEVAAYAWIATHLSLHWLSSWPPIVLGITAYLAWDFGFYWLHRMHHKLGWLWAVHVVHHQGEHFNLSLGIRNAWASSLTSLPFFVFMAVLGIPVEVFLAVSSLHYGIQFYNHNGLITHSGWLDSFMVTPKHHRIHHGCNPEYIDKNFGSSLIIWDKLFGTFQTEQANAPIQYGCHGWQSTYNPFWANLLPILRYLQFKEPVLTAKFPPTNHHRTIFCGGVLCFLTVINFVYQEASLSHWQALILIILIALQTCALGGLSDHTKWGKWLWLVCNVSLFAMNRFIEIPYPWPFILLNTLNLIHATWCLWQISVSKTPVISSNKS